MEAESRGSPDEAWKDTVAEGLADLLFGYWKRQANLPAKADTEENQEKHTE